MTLRYSERMDAFGTSIIRELFALAMNPEIITLAGGAPAPELYPIEAFSKASAKAFEEYGIPMIAYDTTDGYEPLRKIIAEERMTSVGVDTSSANIFITTGSQQGIDFSGRLFLDKGDLVIVESPTYLGAVNSFDSYQCRYAEVPMDENGMITEVLEDVLKKNPEAKMIYINPDFQNPTGLSMGRERRKALVDLATAYNVPIVEDSPYIEMRYEGEKIPSVKSFDTSGIVIYLGSFSKICAPGVRLGWICASDELLPKYNKIKQACDLHSSTICQRQLTKYMEMYSLDEQIKKMIPAYKLKRDTMMEIMENEFPDSVSFTRPEGGFFTWVTVPEKYDTVELFKKAVEKKVAFVPGAPFFVEKGHDNHMRVNYSFMPVDKVAEGTKRLAKLLQSLD
ncbi:MAG: PLP-dependent aminotransferase family protein [Deltaproteobacteria bacterium]|nr:PLP-dependent aminotransferase family protein [Deltaproteobacteria bacterium]